MYRLACACASIASVVACWIFLLAPSAVASSSLSWSGPSAVDPQASGVTLDRISCPSTTQCTAVDARGQAVTFNPQAPHGASTVVVSTHTMSGVSCPSTTQCSAVDLNGQETTFNPQSSAGGNPVEIDSGGVPLGLMCPSASLCTSVDASGQAVTFNPGSGQVIGSGLIDLGRLLVGVDCPGNSTTSCAAVDSSGGAVLFNPQTPSSQTPVQVDGTANASPSSVACLPDKCAIVDNAGTANVFGVQGSQPTPEGSGPIDQTNSGANPLSAVACPSESECVAVDSHGGEAMFNPTLPVSAAIPVDPGQALAGVACPSTSQCTAIDRDGQEVTFDPNSPGKASTAPIDGHTDLAALSCPATSQCTAVDVGGTEVTFAPGTQPNPKTARIDPGSVGVFGVSCPGDGQCTAVDNRGQEVTFNPQAPGSPTPTTIDSGHALFAIACPSATQCTAVDDSGRELTFNPQASGAPKPATVDSGHGLPSLACPTSQQCTAIDDRGAEVTFNPEAPGTPTPYAIDQVPDVALTCPALTQCTAVDGSGDEVTFNPRLPSQASALAIDSASPLVAIACRTMTGCVAVDQAGHALEGDPRGNGAWTGPSVSGSSLADVQCPSALECVSVDQPGNAYLGTSGPLPPVPSRISSPSIAGRTQQGRTLSEHHGRWTNGPTSYGYQWSRCNTRGLRCSLIRGATEASYRPTRADVGHRLRVHETAWNISGPGGAATSRPSSIVRPAVALTLRGVVLSGLSSGHPRLAFTATRGAGDPPVKRISLTLPAGFTVTGSIQRLSATGAGRHRVGFTSVARGRTLTITLRKFVRSVRVVVGGPGISETARIKRHFRSHRRPYFLITFAAVLRGGIHACLRVSPRTS